VKKFFKTSTDGIGAPSAQTASICSAEYLYCLLRNLDHDSDCYNELFRILRKTHSLNASTFRVEAASVFGYNSLFCRSKFVWRLKFDARALSSRDLTTLVHRRLMEELALADRTLRVFDMMLEIVFSNSWIQTAAPSFLNTSSPNMFGASYRESIHFW
jgi:hypothetical protein